MGFWSARTISRQRPHRSAGATGTTWGAAGFKRGKDRVEFEGRVTLVDGDTRISSMSGNLSEGGAFVVTETPPAVGTRVRILVRLGDRLSLATEAVVRWHDFDDDLWATGCGVEFVGLEEAQKQALRAVLYGEEAEAEETVEETVEEGALERATG